MTLALSHPGPLPARAPMSRRRKAAIIVRLLLSEGASLPLGALPDDLQTALTAEIGAMRYIDGDTLRAVVAEFLEELEKIGLTFPGGIEGALRLLDGHISAEAVAGLRNEGGPPDPWPRIAAMEVERLLPLVQAEATEVAAVLLSKLGTGKAAELLGQLPGERARRIACAVSLTAQVSPEIVARIGATLLDQLEALPKRAFADPPGARMGAILNATPAATRDDVLAGLQEADAGFADTVRRAIFTFTDIPDRVEPRDVPAITRGIAGDVLVTALAGAAGVADAAAAFVLENMSRRMADQLRGEVEERGTVKAKDADAAMAEVVSAVRALADAGEITLIMQEEEE